MMVQCFYLHRAVLGPKWNDFLRKTSPIAILLDGESNIVWNGHILSKAGFDWSLGRFCHSDLATLSSSTEFAMLYFHC